MLAGDGKALGRGWAEGEGCGAGRGQNRELRWRQNAFSPRRGAWCPLLPVWPCGPPPECQLSGFPDRVSNSSELDCRYV